MATPSSDKLAVLIDADNAQASVATEFLREVARYGTATVKRAYGDWTLPNLNGWKEVLHNLAIRPIQQFRYTVGKNATDAALIIDAMDLLHSGTVDGFCLVSSDSDFTCLATRVRQAGLSVYGFGEQKTPKPFVAACDKFVFEILRPVARDAAAPKPSNEPLQPALASAVTAAAKEDRWAPLSNVGSLVVKASPSFDPRNYGFQKLGDLVRAQPYLEVKSVPASDGSPIAHLFVRLKKA
jgi:uncharacterized LabA/DUF88 family protein